MDDDDLSLDFGKKKKKKSKAKEAAAAEGGEGGEAGGAPAEEEDELSLDLSLGKKKKKKVRRLCGTLEELWRTGGAGRLALAHGGSWPANWLAGRKAGRSCCRQGSPAELLSPPLTSACPCLAVPCLPQKAKARGEDEFGGMEEEGGGGEGEHGGGGLPWEGSDRDYTYEELLGELNDRTGWWKRAVRGEGEGTDDHDCVGGGVVREELLGEEPWNGWMHLFEGGRWQL